MPFVPASGQSHVTVTARRINAGVFIIELPSALVDLDETPYLNSCAPAESDRRGFLLLDFSKVERINGLGASMMVKLAALARKRSQRIIAFGMNDSHKIVLQLTGLRDAMQICRDLADAYGNAGLPVANSLSPTASVPASDAACWAIPLERLLVPEMPSQAINMNMRGRRVVGPVHGFGPLWQKKYQLAVPKAGLSPEDIIKVLKQNFPRFQPKYNRFYPTEKGILPGEVIAIDSSTPGGPVSTGVMVLYADRNSFTLITPQGHPESGWVTFSAFLAKDRLVAQIVGLARANDPIYELAFRSVGSNMQIRIWTHVLTSLAAYLGVPADVGVEANRVDPGVRWSEWRNVWYNAQIRTMLASPVWLGRRLNSRGSEKE
jgi:hypothetical protein